MIERYTDLRVGYRDTDQMGVVHHAVYLEYFERGRTECLRQIGAPYSAIEEGGLILPLLEYGARMVSPARYDNVVRVYCRIVPPDGPRLRIDYAIARGVTLLVSGHTVHTFARAGSMRPVRPPASFMELLRAADTESPQADETGFEWPGVR